MRKSAMLLPALAVLVLSGCSNNKDEIANPIIDPVGHTADMIDLKNQMQQNIENSAAQENERLNNTLNENNSMSDVAKTLGDNSALVKKIFRGDFENQFGGHSI